MTGQSRVEVTGGFLLLVAWLNYLDRSFVVPLALAACGVHELGHIFVIRRMGGAIKGIRLTAVGAELILSRPLGYWQEGLSALAGPGVNLLLALAFARLGGRYVAAGANLLLGCFNLLPVPALDGGRALHLLVSWVLDPMAADRICRRVGLGCALLLTAGALFLTVRYQAGLFLLLGASGTLIPQLSLPVKRERRLSH